ncbi:MAG: bacillithiol system redox-active protein YtxJ [Thalassobius sp.]|nr:bacillithiol system redox-active protein YtxJ [Thalassovita sp.]
MSFFKNIFSNSSEKGENAPKDTLTWIPLQSEDQLNEVVEKSKDKPVVIFKHSTTCSISGMVKNRLERSWDIPTETSEVYYLDLLSYRSISNKIAEVFGVIHESPQVLVIKDGKSVFDTSHYGITTDAIKESLA